MGEESQKWKWCYTIDISTIYIIFTEVFEPILSFQFCWHPAEIWRKKNEKLMSQNTCISKSSSFCLNQYKFKTFPSKCWHLVVKNENFIISLHHQIFDFCTNNLHDSIAQWKQAGLACMRSWVQTQVVPIFFFLYFFNNFSLLFFNALVIPYFIQTDMSNFFPTFFQLFSIFSIFFSTCSQHVPNLFPISPNFFPTFLPTFFNFSKSTFFQLCINFFQLFNRLF